MKRLPFLGLLFVLLCFASCWQMGAEHLLREADKQVEVNVDSVNTLLSRIKNPSQLTGEHRLLYGWLKAYTHYEWNSSMVEDTLTIPAADYYISRRDTARMYLSYLLKARYLYWTKQYEHSVALLDTGISVALAQRDTNAAVKMLTLQGGDYVYAQKDNPRAIVALRRAVQLRETPGRAFSLGIAMALTGHDSASYFMNRSVELALQKKDTAKVVHYLRNYAQFQAYIGTEFVEAIAAIKRMESLTDDVDQLLMGAMVRTEAFLKMGQLDSAQYYLDKGKAITAGEEKFPTNENMISHYQALIDYSRHRTFDILNTMRYNDSIGNALFALQSTIRRKDETKESLSQANLQLTVERQHTQLSLLFALLVVVIAGGGAFFYIRNRRYKLIEAEERIETLNRLLAEVTKSSLPEKEEDAKTDEVEDGAFFRKILLQQLGIIRLVATQPTSQNQELLRRISGITNRELPVESLLIWEDLYPVIDRVYNGFYTKMYRRFGSIFIDKEQQLCCLLCAEFSTKEISVVTQQSIPTIYQRKTNIRKKLGMEEKEDIVEFILNE